MNENFSKNVQDLTSSVNNMVFCPMDKAILADNKIIITGGVATCFVIVIYHARTKLTLFAHVNSSQEIIKIQEKFLAFFTKKSISLNELKIYLAGGLRSFFESSQKAEELKNFWINQEVTFNAELLLSRDAKLISKHSDFIQKMHIEFKKNLNISFEDYKRFFEEVVNPSQGFFYHHRRLHSKKIYFKIESKIKNFVIKHLISENIVNQAYVDKHKLLMVQLSCNPKNKDEERLLISFHDPFASVLHLVGFNLETGEFFISTDDCNTLMDNVTTIKEENNLTYADTIPIVDLTNLRSSSNRDQKTTTPFEKFLVASSSNAHEDLIANIEDINLLKKIKCKAHLKLMFG